MKDMPLLQRFVRENSEAAFKELVERHLNLVYAAALRQVRDPSLAQDVVQAVFLILARKAGKISANTILSGWLYRTTHFVAAKALRSELRRKHHEQEAAQMQTTDFAAPDRAWEKLAPVLDDVMVQLNEKDRNAILLRYFENKDLGSVGYALGTSEDAAQKRVSRALEKLRRLFIKRGIVLPTLALGSTLTAHAMAAAPTAQFSEAIIVNCLNKSVISPTIFSLVQESLRQLFCVKLAKTAGATALLLACAFFFVENFPKQTKETEIARTFGPGNNSVAPKKKIGTHRRPGPEAIAPFAIVEPDQIVQPETAPVVVANLIKPEPKITNAPTKLLRPVATQSSRNVNTAATQTRRSGSYVFPPIAQTNTDFADVTLTVTNGTPQTLPVYQPRRFDKPILTRPRPQRKATPRPSPRNDGERRVF